ncbi:MAG: TonB-dependent receptor [Desulfuromonadaceae bacterium]
MKQKHIRMGALSLVIFGSSLNGAYAAETEITPVPVTGQSVKPAEAAEQTTQNLGEAVVSAEKDKPVQQRTELGMLTKETPLAGTVVPREELEFVRSLSALQEIMRRVPSVSMSRNMRFPDGGKNYTDGRTDGMKARNTGTTSFIDQSNTGDIERVEIIRGPGSVLNSSNAIGGTINVISRNPPKKLENEVTAEYFGDGGYRAGATSGAQISPNLGYFANVNRQDTTGWRDHTEETKDSFSAKAIWNPEDVAKLSARLEYLHDDYQDAGTINEAQFNENWRQAQLNTFLRTDVTYTTPSLQYRRLFGEVGELNVYGQVRLTDQTQRGTGSGGGGGLGINDIKSTDTNIQSLYKHSFDFAKTAVTIGLDNFFTTTKTKSYADADPNTFNFVRGALTGNSNTEENHNSPFVQLEFSPIKPLRFSVGTRYDNIEYVVDDQINDKKDGSKKYDRFVTKVGATYDLDKNNLVWLNVAQGFLAPSVSTLLGSNSAPPATPADARRTRYVPTNMDLSPESSLTAEIGARGILRNSFSYDVDYYHTDFKDLIVSQLCETTEICYTKNLNAGSATAYGVESTLGYTVNRYLETGLSYTYSHYKYDKWITATTNYSNKHRSSNPDHHYNVRVAVKPVTGLKAELEMDYITNYYTNSTNTDSYQRPALFNLRVNYNYKNWGFWGTALNLFDVKYAERISATDAGVRSSYSAGYGPLTLRAGVSYKF